MTFRPEDLSLGGLAQPLQAQGRALLDVTGGARRASGTPSAAVGQEDRLDRFAVVLEAQRRLGHDLAGADNRREERDGGRQAGRRFCEPPGPPAAAHGNTTVLLRFGTWPTGMRAISLISCVSTTDTSFDPAFATYR